MCEVSILFKYAIISRYRRVEAIYWSASHERPVAAMRHVFQEILGRLCGRLAAAIVGWPNSSLGSGSKILGTACIEVEKGACIKRLAWIEAIFAYNEQRFTPSIKIGQRFFASDRLHISAIDRIEIGDNCLVGSGVYISDHNHGSYRGEEQSLPSEPPIRRKLTSRGPVIIGANVWLGDNVVIVGPVCIGNGVVIGANSVVTRDIPDHVIAVGAPLRIVKSFDEKNARWEAC